MACQGAREILTRLSGSKIVPVVRVHSPATARLAMKALIDAGFRTAEITMTVPGATDVIRELSSESDFLVGAGTILDIRQAEASISAGAKFVVSPVIVEGLADLCREADVLSVMSGLTPNEVFAAWQKGSGAVKVFPARSMGGPGHIRSLKVVFPDIPLIPTGGVNIHNLADYLRAGAAFVGVGGDLVNEKYIDQGRTDIIIELGKKYLKSAQETEEGGYEPCISKRS